MRFTARGKLVLREVPDRTWMGEPCGFFDSEDLASLAAAGMNRIMSDHPMPRHEPTSSERLVAGTDFRDPGDSPTTVLPRLDPRGHPV